MGIIIRGVGKWKSERDIRIFAEERKYRMNLMNKLERKFGRYAIPNLMYYIVILYAVGVLVQMMAPAFYIQYLMLDARAILHGQIWRIITFMIWPPSTSL